MKRALVIKDYAVALQEEGLSSEKVMEELMRSFGHLMYWADGPLFGLSLDNNVITIVWLEDDPVIRYEAKIDFESKDITEDLKQKV